MNPPKGCKFHPRCPIAQERCQREEPVLTRLDSGQNVACHFPGEFEWAPEVSITDGTF